MRRRSLAPLDKSLKLANLSRDPRRHLIAQLFEQVGQSYQEKGLIEGFEVHFGSDVSAFYMPVIRDKTIAIHVQGYTGMSSEDQFKAIGRVLAYGKVMQIKALNQEAIGSEHEAHIRYIQELDSQSKFPYNPLALMQKISAAVPQLR